MKTNKIMNIKRWEVNRLLEVPEEFDSFADRFIDHCLDQDIDPEDHINEAKEWDSIPSPITPWKGSELFDLARAGRRHFQTYR